jgi:prophage regulatory protein
MSEKKLERILSVLNRTADTRSGWYAKVSRGEAPKPVKLAGGRAAAWVSTEIDAYIEQQIAARDAHPKEAILGAGADTKAAALPAPDASECGTLPQRSARRVKAGGGNHG